MKPVDAKDNQVAIDISGGNARAHTEECANLLTKYFKDNGINPAVGLYVAAMTAVALWKYQGQPVEPLLSTILINWDSLAWVAPPKAQA